MDMEQNYLDPERTMKYAVFSIRNSLENGISYRRSFIVLKNGSGMIVRFTRLEDYAGIYSWRTYKPLQADPEPKLYFICGMLNSQLTIGHKIKQQERPWVCIHSPHYMMSGSYTYRRGPRVAYP